MRSTWIILLLFSLSCDVPQESTNEVIDPLASWNDGVTKMSILHFIDGVVNPESEHFVRPADRIAVFDNDGTLWPEQPFYFQLFFTLDRVRALADAHPEWQDTEPFKAVLEGDMGALLSQGEHGLL
jgi:hypothetical protein